jgi:YHS domain-containing protein
MRYIQRAVCTLAMLVVAAGVGTVVPEAAQNGSPQKNCPVMGGAVSKDSFKDYNGRRVYFCCSGCRGDFDKDPEKYMKKLEEQRVTPEVAPAN